MFKNLTYKHKFWSLVVLLIVLGITAYKRSFSITMDAREALNLSKQKLGEVKNSQQKITNLKTEIAHLDKIIGKQAANEDLVQQEILNMFNEINNGSSLVKLEEIHTAKNNYFNIYTNRLILSGGFNDLLRTTYHFEKEFQFSRIVSLRFYMEKQSKTRKKELFQQIIFQNYEKIR